MGSNPAAPIAENLWTSNSASIWADLYRRGREHDAEKTDRLARLRNVEPDTARMLAVLVRALEAKRLLELGTSNGYSTMWLADSARSVGGRLVSVDVDPTRIAQAAEHLSHVQLRGHVELRTEDAAATLSQRTMPLRT